MAVFRVERTRDYTVMCNHHLKDSNLSLKAKGLLSMMLSLPDEWNYTTRGLAAICKEGVDAIGKNAQGAGAGGLHHPPSASRQGRAHFRHGVHHLREAPKALSTGYDFTRYGKPVSG